MAQPTVRPAVTTPPATPAAAKLRAVPFVVDTNVFAHGKAWHSKSTSKTPNRVGMPLGAILMRIAGSTSTFSVPVQIRFDDANANPTPFVGIPMDDAYFAQPLIVSDTDADAAELANFWADATSKFFTAYRTATVADKLDLDKATHADIAALVTNKAPGIGVVKIR